MIYNRLENIFTSILNESKRGVNEHTGQIQFNCPECATNSFHTNSDGKFNLELNFQRGVYKCWCCGETNNMSGRLSTLIKKYSSNELLKEYYSEIKNIKDLLIFNDFEGGNETNVCYDCEVFIPKSAKIINEKDYQAKEVIKYLNGRGIDLDTIKKYKLYYTNFNVNSNERKLIKVVILPSYDKWGSLNYWVGRKYDNFPSNQKYCNPDDSKKSDIIFNEQLINWDGDIRLVEGPFDHIVVPNSIPLLGKVLDENSYLYEELLKNVKGTVTIFLDAEALDNTKKIYIKLNKGLLKNKIRYVTYNNFESHIKEYNLNNNKIILNDLDPSKIYELFGKNGIILALKDVEVFDEFDLIC